MTNTTLLLDAHKLHFNSLRIFAKSLCYLGKCQTFDIEIGNLTLTLGQAYHRLRLAYHTLMLADAAQRTAHLLEVEYIVLDVLRQEIVLAEVTTDEALNHLILVTLIHLGKHSETLREPMLYFIVQRIDNVVVELSQPS